MAAHGAAMSARMLRRVKRRRAVAEMRFSALYFHCLCVIFASATDDLRLYACLLPPLLIYVAFSRILFSLCLRLLRAIGCFKRQMIHHPIRSYDMSRYAPPSFFAATFRRYAVITVAAREPLYAAHAPRECAAMICDVAARVVRSCASGAKE